MEHLTSRRASAVALTLPRRALAGLLAAAVAGVGALAPADARAGTMTYHSCIQADGAVGSVAGWTGAASHLGGALLDCATWQGLGAILYYDGPWTQGTYGQATFTAPANTKIAAVDYQRSSRVPGPGAPWSSHIGWYVRIDGAAREYCAPYGGVCPGNEYQALHERSYSGLNADTLSVEVGCASTAGGPCEEPVGAPESFIRLTRARITLRDVLAPSVTVPPSGSLTAPGGHDGNDALLANATDAGSGVYRTIVTVDGAIVSRTVVDANGGACVDANVGNADPYEFNRPQPCLLSKQLSAQLDTTQLTEGEHRVEVHVEDATGNRELVFENDRYLVDNHAPPTMTSAPFISGEAQEERRLVANDGVWSNAATASRQWKRCDGDGLGCAPISGAIGQEYQPSSGDLGRRLLVEVTAGNGVGETTTVQSPTSQQVRAKPSSTGGFTTQTGTNGSNATSGSNGGEGPVHVGAPNGVGASRGARVIGVVSGSGGSLRTVFGRRVKVLGRLVDERGAPIRSARLAVTATRRVPRATGIPEGSVTTDGEGRFSYLAPVGPSRELAFGYRAFSEDRELSSETRVLVLVRATGSLRATPRTLRNGQKATFTGRVNGGFLPSGGVVVDVQAKVCRTSKGKARCEWRTIRSPRTNARGRFAASYRFTRTFQRTVYVFRSVVRQDSDWPFLGGTIGGSAKVTVKR